MLAFGVGTVMGGILGGGNTDIGGVVGAMLLKQLKGGGQHQLMPDEMYLCHLLLGLGYHVPTIQAYADSFGFVLDAQRRFQ
eukprot:7122435-Ditylum_brightwellii.AAC.1